MKKSTNDLLERLVKEMVGQRIHEEIPPGAVSPDMLAKATGLNPRSCYNLLNERVKNKELTKVLVKLPGDYKAKTYYVET